jgi:hypothetical protein
MGTCCSHPWQIYAQEETTIISWRECSKKHALSLFEGSVQQGRSYFDARSVHGVREHGKKARTPLVAFFNIPIWPIGTECLSGIQILEGKFFMSEGHEI